MSDDAATTFSDVVCSGVIEALKVLSSEMEDEGTGKALKDDPEATSMKIVDCGGQPVHASLQQLLLNRYATYLVVFSMEAVTHKKKPNRESGWSFVEQWLDTIASSAPNAPIFIVGTHADIVNDDSKHNAISSELFERFSSHKAFQTVVQNQPDSGLWFWPVDNTLSGQRTHSFNTQNQPHSATSTQATTYNVHALRAAITRVSCDSELNQLHVPITWTALYDKLVRVCAEENKPAMPLGEAVKIGAMFNFSDEEDVVRCLRLWHAYGLILYRHGHPELRQVVVVNPEWYMDLMSRVVFNVRKHTLHNHHTLTQAHAEDISLFVNHATLTYTLVSALWEDISAEQVDMLLDYMTHVGLITCMVDYTVNPDAHTNHSTDDNYKFFVPHALPITPPTTPAPSSSHQDMLCNTVAAATVAQYGGVQDSAKDGKIAYMLFSTEPRCKAPGIPVSSLASSTFLPEGVFARVLCAVYSNTYFLERDAQVLSRTQASFNMHGTTVKLSLVPSMGAIKVAILSEEPRHLLLAIYNIIRDVVMIHYRTLKCHVAVPFSSRTVVYLDSIQDAYATHEQASERVVACVERKPLNMADITRLYACWLPSYSQQPTGQNLYISYRQHTGSSFVARLQRGLYEYELSSFADSRISDQPPEVAQMDLLNELTHAVVACPILSEASITPLFQIGKLTKEQEEEKFQLELTMTISELQARSLNPLSQHVEGDYCDHVLLEWWYMLEIAEKWRARGSAGLFDATGASITLRAIAPMVLSSAWSNTNDAKSVVGVDTYDDFYHLCSSLPNVVSKKTMARLEVFMEEKFGKGAFKPQVRTIRSIVRRLLTYRGVNCWEAAEVFSGSYSAIFLGKPDAVPSFQRAQRTNRIAKAVHYAGFLYDIVVFEQHCAKELVKTRLREEKYRQQQLAIQRAQEEAQREKERKRQEAARLNEELRIREQEERRRRETQQHQQGSNTLNNNNNNNNDDDEADREASTHREDTERHTNDDDDGDGDGDGEQPGPMHAIDVIRRMTVDDVSQWLDSIHMSSLQGLFRENNIDGNALVEITSRHLTDWGVSQREASALLTQRFNLLFRNQQTQVCAVL